MIAETLETVVNGVGGSILGVVGSFVTKSVGTYMDNQQKRAEWKHIEVMFDKQAEWDAKQLTHDSQIEQLNANITALTASYDHDKSFKPSTKVDNVRALVRPLATLGGFFATAYNPVVFAEYLGLMLGWWFGERSRKFGDE